MDATRNKNLLGNPDLQGQIWYVCTYKWILSVK